MGPMMHSKTEAEITDDIATNIIEHTNVIFATDIMPGLTRGPHLVDGQRIKEPLMRQVIT